MPYTPSDLALADLNIMQAERNAAKQRATIKQLQERGVSAKQAELLLETFEECVATLKAQRSHIAAQLERRRHA